MRPEVDNAEYAMRHQKARELMAENDLNALIITEPANLFYFTGASYFGEMSFPRPAVLIIPRKGKAMLITHEFHLPIGWDGDIREYPKVGEVPVEMVKRAFAEIGCSQGRVGAEFGREQRLGISYRDLTNVQDALSAVSFVDAADILWQLRMVKSEAEIAILSEACRIQDSIFKRASDAIKSNMTTSDIKKLFQHAIIESDADLGWVIVCIGDYDPQQSAGSSLPERRLKDSDLLWVDLGVTLHGYHTDYCRGMVAGAASAEQLEKWGKVRKILEAGVDAVIPGMPSATVYKAQVDAAEKLKVDMTSWPARRYGHGSGLHTTEPPYISLDDNTILEPGMILHIEPGSIEKDGIYVLEEQVVVTENGCDVLSQAPWELQAYKG